MSVNEKSSSNGHATRPATSQAIRVRGARTHNLRNLDLEIPRNQLVVLTGVSGSGKSSLAFDTLYAEGKRQYIESLSVYARQFLEQIARPDVDIVDGLQPTICIDQRPGSVNPRSTVATVTEIYDYLRLLMARLGSVSCYRCGTPIRQQTTDQIVDRIMALPPGTKTMILAPVVRGRKGHHRETLAKIRRCGLVRVRVDGLVCELDDFPDLVPQKNHDIDAVVDRVIIREEIQSRLLDSVRAAVDFADGLMSICYLTPEAEALSQQEGHEPHWSDSFFSTRYACPDCQISYEEIVPRTFSFNSPYGACPQCEGLGVRQRFDEQLVVPDRSRSLEGGAVDPWTGAVNKVIQQNLSAAANFLQQHQLSVDTPLETLTPEQWKEFFMGPSQLAGDAGANGTSNSGPAGKRSSAKKPFVGVLQLLEKEYATCTRRSRLRKLEQYRAHVRCRDCEGSRLRPEAGSVTLAGQNIAQITDQSIRKVIGFFESLSFKGDAKKVAVPLVSAILNRLRFLQHVGVDYLTLGRPADSLSGGEFQRVRLATSIGSGLVSVCYILDEPSIGLHPRDNQQLIEAVRNLKTQGNSVIVVEHDEAMVQAADLVIDMGPGAGRQGGAIVAMGSVEQIKQTAGSLTGDFLAGRRRIAPSPKRRRLAKTRSLVIQQVATHNLKQIDVRIPLGAFVCITGVSGSGKSSLVNETLAPALLRRMGKPAPAPGPFRGLRGAHQVDHVIQIDQSAIGRSPRSNAATYTGVFDEIRKVFANTREAKQRGFNASRFSFNNKEGRCAACEGYGVRKIEMSFMPDMFVTCDTCDGARFNRQTLQAAYRGRNVADVLAMSVDSAAEFFQNFSNIARVLQGLQQVGLGYLSLGQPSTTLSGGEAQRIKLANELARVDTGCTLYFLDEPTTGLHLDDIRRLLLVIDQLVDRGNTVVVIEHNLDVIKCADWVIDLGPEGGDAGGYIVAEGEPHEIAACEQSITGRYLAQRFAALQDVRDERDIRDLDQD